MDAREARNPTAPSLRDGLRLPWPVAVLMALSVTLLAATCGPPESVGADAKTAATDASCAGPGCPPSDSGIVGGDGPARTDGVAPSGSWALEASSTTNHLVAVWGTSDSDVWTVGFYGTILHWNGEAWSGFASGTSSHLSGLWGSGANDVWAVGGGLGTNGTILHWNGSEWSTVDLGSTDPFTAKQAVWGSGAADVWAVGGYPPPLGLTSSIHHWDGSSWTPIWTDAVNGLTSTWWDVWGFSGGDVWVVGEMGKMIHWNGTDWAATDPFVLSSLNAIWGSSAVDIWAVGNGGQAIRWNGITWEVIPTGGVDDLWGVWGSDSTDVWAVGWHGAIRHWDGSVWSMVASGSVRNLSAVWGSGPADIWAVGEAGAILRHRLVPSLRTPSARTGTKR